MLREYLLSTGPLEACPSSRHLVDVLKWQIALSETLQPRHDVEDDVEAIAVRANAAVARPSISSGRRKVHVLVRS